MAKARSRRDESVQTQDPAGAAVSQEAGEFVAGDIDRERIANRTSREEARSGRARSRIEEQIPPAREPAGAMRQDAGDSSAADVDREQIAHRAYELYIARGGADGRALDDWLAAERELADHRGRDR